MSAPSTGTCAPWATLEDIPEGAACADLDAALVTTMLQVASDVLFDLTGRRWPGECESTVRPCGFRTRHRWGGEWLGCSCADRRSCGCRPLSEVRLPGWPVTGITEVMLDGVVLSSDRYRVDDWRWLVYLPESDTAERRGWPCCQRLDLDTTEADTWAVTYPHGVAPPAGGVMAAASLGCQLALAATPATAGQCQLPKRVTSVVRQGTSLTLLDNMQVIREGGTGLADVDLWVTSANLGAARRPATVWSPNGTGGHRFRRTTTPAGS